MNRKNQKGQTRLIDAPGDAASRSDDQSSLTLLIHFNRV
jgi:hypothetical protein